MVDALGERIRVSLAATVTVTAPWYENRLRQVMILYGIGVLFFAAVGLLH
jgi:hypothetical protein